MSERPEPDLDELLIRLEATIALLAGGTAPLDELVAAHERATRLVAQAEARLAMLRAHAEETASRL